jgi:hypothetical protein
MKQIILVLAFAALAVGPASAASIFLQWSTPSGQSIQWSGSANGYTATIPVTVTLQSSGITNSQILTDVYNNMPVDSSFTANLTYSWKPAGPAMNPFANFYDQLVSGSVSIVDTGRGASSTGYEILSAVFTNAEMYFLSGSPAPSISLTGNMGGTTAAGGLPQTLTYSSSLLTFDQLTAAGMTIGSSDGGPYSLNGNGYLANWTGGGNGTFSAMPATEAHTPEPGTFALLGTGLIAASLLGRQRLQRRA